MIEFKRVFKNIRVDKITDGKCVYEFIDADTLLKQFLTAYLEGVEETEDEKLAMLAHIAGFEVSDKTGDVWKLDESADKTMFCITCPPLRIIRPQPEPSKAEQLQTRLDALQKEIDSVRAELEGGAV